MDEHCNGTQAIALTNVVEKSYGNRIAKCDEIFVGDAEGGVSILGAGPYAHLLSAGLLLQLNCGVRAHGG